MSAEYSVDGILAVAEAADNGDVRHPGMVADMLREFARIKAAQGQGEAFGYIDHHEIQKMSDVGHAQVLSRPLPELGITIPVYLTAQPAQARQVPDELEAYDAGLLNDFGGGNVEWWQGYIRGELGRAHDFYQSQIAAPPATSEGKRA